jgi:2,3-dihydroxybenzoate decarboxylase
MIRKIALEEHFLCPGFDGYWRATVGSIDPTVASGLLARLTDFGEMRLETMDRAGIARSVLSIAGPGVQRERDAAVAVRRAREANDYLAREVEKRLTAIRALRTCRCRTRRRRRPNWNVACAN